MTNKAIVSVARESLDVAEQLFATGRLLASKVSELTDELRDTSSRTSDLGRAVVAGVGLAVAGKSRSKHLWIPLSLAVAGGAAAFLYLKRERVAAGLEAAKGKLSPILDGARATVANSATGQALRDKWAAAKPEGSASAALT